MKLPTLSFTFYLLLFGFALLLLWGGCNCLLAKSLTKQLDEYRAEGNKIITVNTVDTVLLKQTDTFTKVVSKPYAVIQHRVDSFLAFEPLPFDTVAALQKYFTENFLLDSIKTTFGTVFIYDTLFRNAITGRSVITDFTIPVVTNTVTQTIPERKSTQVFAGFTLVGGKADPFNAAGPSLLLKTKGEKLYEVFGLYNRQSAWWFGASLKWKLKFN